jgi:hypothetical protein
MNEDFKVGDVVWLKSCSDPLTIIELQADESDILLAKVCWMANPIRMSEATLPVQALTKIKPTI